MMNDAGKDAVNDEPKITIGPYQLVLEGPSVTITVVSSQPEREIVIQATGHVSFAHAAPGGTEWRGKDLLMIRNDRWLEQ